MMDEHYCMDCVFARGDDGFCWCLLNDKQVDEHDCDMPCHREGDGIAMTGEFKVGYLRGHAAGMREAMGS